ncbi:DUF1275 domain-containing protein [Streptomyces sp. NBC_01635]|uniref:DUF1275 family protein n=1 Tax=Streptomyces sp. NBC_01635 TaxID=2975904 RepID=UPI00386B1ECB|nr:DUF1275 domain-containing protein [Streptomyces sp. NBC_01635]
MSSPVHPDRLRRALVVVTAVTGIVDAMAFLGLGQVLTPFMTGNLPFLGFVLAGGEGLELLGPATALAVSVTGVVVGSRPGAALAVERHRRWLLTSASVAAALLVDAALTAIGLDIGTGREPEPRHYLVIAPTAVR